MNSAPINQFIAALQDEIDEIKKKGGGARLVASSGRLLSMVGGKHIYSFALTNAPSSLLDDAVVEVRTAGTSVNGTVVTASQSELVVALDQHLGAELQETEIIVNFYFLIELLQKRLGELDASSQLLGNKALGFVAPRVGEAESPLDFGNSRPNEEQEAAVRHCAGSEVTFIWGPPGTGKTKTLGFAAKALIDGGRSVLLVSNTNIATDNALKAVLSHVRGQKDYQDGAYLRLGTPALTEIQSDPNVNLEQVVKRKGESILCEKHDLLRRIDELEERKASLEILKESMEEEQRCARSIRGIEKRINDLKLLQCQQSKALEKKRREYEHIPTFSALIRFMLYIFGHTRRLASDIGNLQEKVRSGEEQLRTLQEQLKAAVKAREQHIERVRTLSVSFSGLETSPTNLESSLSLMDEELSLTKSRVREITDELATLRRRFIDDAKLVATTVARTYTMDEVMSRSYDVVFCDEASMVSPPAVLAACSLGNQRAVLAGDPLQLAPIAVADTDLARRWLRSDSFRLNNLDSFATAETTPLVCVLRQQYRMRPEIRSLVSALSYAGRLVDAAELSTISPPVSLEPLPEAPIVLVDLPGKVPRSARDSNWSHYNFYSAIVSFHLALKLCACLREAQASDGQPQPMVAIITPYRRQMQVYRRMIEDAGVGTLVVASTIHRFQGLEAAAVIFDTVDDHGAGRIGKLLRGGFPDDGARLVNVAFSRAQQKLCLVGNLTYLREKLSLGDLLGQALLLRLPRAPTLDGEQFAAEYLHHDLERLQKLLGKELEHIQGVQFHSEDRFYDALRRDLASAQNQVHIYSAFVTPNRVGQLMPLLSQLLARGVRVVVHTRRGEAHPLEMRAAAGSALAMLQQAGATLNLVDRLHQKIVFIDESVTWFGSLNVLSHRNSAETMLRLPFPATTREFMRAMGLSAASEAGGVAPVLQATEIPDRQCVCGKMMRLQPSGQSVPFFNCTGCPKTRLLRIEDLAEVALDGFLVCDRCGKALAIRKGSRGAFLGCTGYPGCKFTKNLIVKRREPDKVSLGSTSVISSTKSSAQQPVKQNVAANWDSTYYQRSSFDASAHLRASIVSPIPPEWTPANRYLLNAEELERAGAPKGQIEAELEKARKADPDGCRTYHARKSIKGRNRR